MRLFDRLKRWSEVSDTDKGVMDRRAFLKGMAVTSAGLLVPGATVFDLGRSSRGLQDLWSNGGAIEIWTGGCEDLRHDSGEVRFDGGSYFPGFGPRDFHGGEAA